MARTTKPKQMSTAGRPRIKADPLLVKLQVNCDAWLRDKAKKENKTMVRILEDLIDEKRLKKAVAA